MSERLTPSQAQRLAARIKALSLPMNPKPTGMTTKLTPLLDVRAVLFDVYGTLFISGSGDIGVAKAEYDENAFREALVATGIINREINGGVQGTQLLTQLIGKAHEERRRQGVDYPEVEILTIWKAVFERLAKDLPEHELSWQQLYQFAVEYENRVNPVWPMPGLKEILSTLRARGKILGIVSNAQFYTPLLFHTFLGGSPKALGFDPHCCAWSYQLLEAKPSTRLFKKILDNLERIHNIPAAQTLYIGNDLLNDVWPANRLGCKTALFAGDQRSLRLREGDERCDTVKPDLIIDDLKQLAIISA